MASGTPASASSPGGPTNVTTSAAGIPASTVACETGGVAVEIERKFLVGELPTGLNLGHGEQIRQGYLAEEGDVAVRVRITDRAATLTVKAGRGRARTEVERPLATEEAESLWHHTGGRRIAKVRHRIELDDGNTAELDDYAGPLDGLLTVEVEFEDADAASAFDPPAWFGRDVTDEPGWSNAELARHGRPPT